MPTGKALLRLSVSADSSELSLIACEVYHEKACFLQIYEIYNDADQLHGYLAADQRLCFHYIDIGQSLYFLNLKVQLLAIL